jgi:hypothetical protein
MCKERIFGNDGQHLNALVPKHHVVACKICFTTKESVKRKKDSGKEMKGWSGGGEPQASMLGNIKLGLLACGQDPEGSIHTPFSYTNKLRLPAHFPSIAKI